MTIQHPEFELGFWVPTLWRLLRNKLWPRVWADHQKMHRMMIEEEDSPTHGAIGRIHGRQVDEITQMGEGKRVICFC